ncbi:MAG: hypothetical protein N2039_07740 [Gemmataceae bacterium]|nr:hypothetical protein [Gemmataceae bacterium]
MAFPLTGPSGAGNQIRLERKADRVKDLYRMNWPRQVTKFDFPAATDTHLSLIHI